MCFAEIYTFCSLFCGYCAYYFKLSNHDLVRKAGEKKVTQGLNFPTLIKCKTVMTEVIH